MAPPPVHPKQNRCLRGCRAAPITWGAFRRRKAYRATWEESRAECLAHGRGLCTLEQVEAGIGCSFDTNGGGQQLGGQLWTQSPCGANNATPREYRPIRYMADVCTRPEYVLGRFAQVSFDECLSHCDAAKPQKMVCATVAYSFVTKDCRLLRSCRSVLDGTTYGQCEHGWMLQPRDRVQEWLRIYNRTVGRPEEPGFQWCHYTRGETSVTSTAIRRRKRFASVWRVAQKVRLELKRQHPRPTICSAPLLQDKEEGHVLMPTYTKVWRYYTAFECGDAGHRQICLSFKKMGGGRQRAFRPPLMIPTCPHALLSPYTPSHPTWTPCSPCPFDAPRLACTHAPTHIGRVVLG